MMSEEAVESLDSVIATLNNLGMGALDKIDSDLCAVQSELELRELPELSAKVDACRQALARGDLKEFRRLRESIVSRLGHLRVKSTF